MRVRTLLDSPRTGAVATWALLALLMELAFLVRASIQIDGALDTDAINVGLAALRFDVLDHQPHPPGYPGYVLVLRLVHILFPSLGPLEVATWTCRATGVLTIPATYWACRQALGRPSRADLRPFAAAALAILHPILWYYGGDGQSHDVEALATLLLFGLALRNRDRGPGARLVLVAACGLAGCLRPTIALLGAPVLLWCYYRRPLREWLLAAVVGVAAVLAWWLPAIHLSGGLDLYLRAERALVSDLFIANYSVFGSRATLGFVSVNLMIATYSFLVAAIPLVALARRPGAWRLPWVLAIATNLAFYLLVYTAEAGYFSGVAALACLVPATWPDARRPWLRGGLAAALSLGLVTLGPAEAPFVHWRGGIFLPTLHHVVHVESAQRRFREATCASPDGRPVFSVTDDPITTHTRLLPIVCPGVTLGLYFHESPLEPRLDNWLIFYADGMDTLPTEVPLELSPHGGRARLRAPVAWVQAAPDASDELVARLAAQASCAALPSEGPDAPRYWPARCLPELRLGRNVVEVPSL